ncbi:hypothetical protein BDY21DRAFT_357275 [Lineolata rhizophorae]|uniref:Protein kinase domain-containing protein n=1 Tax=Lineolata rhizophorae TaxID=578093 RepID=A0A6A6NN79_9PEZI|nr:hypothetical protein BDY21DRAFT_357275 [Lineolata rhizophorae]
MAVVALEYSHGLPSLSRAQPESSFSRRISLRVMELADQNPQDKWINLLHRMLQMNPQDRPTAQECLPVAKSLLENWPPHPHSQHHANNFLASSASSGAFPGDDQTIVLPSSEI